MVRREAPRLLSESKERGKPLDTHARIPHTHTTHTTHTRARARAGREEAASEREMKEKRRKGGDISRTPRAIGAVVKY